MSNVKKITILLFAAYTAFAFSACTKENADKVDELNQGTRVSFVLDSPDVEVEDPESKVSSDGTTGTGSSFRYKFKWDAGDQIKIVTLNPLVQGDYTDWGMFVTEAGAATSSTAATFTGYAPSNWVGESIVGIHSKYTETFNFGWNQGRIEIGYNIPAEQDGTGFKYAMYAGKYSGDDDADGDIYDAENHQIKITGVSKARWQLYCALTRFQIPDGLHVKRIKVNCPDIKPVSDGTKSDIWMSTDNLAVLWGGGSNDIIISNGGEDLVDVWFASRNIAKNKTLYFEFTDADGNVAKKKVTLTAELSKARVNNFGEIPLTAADFKF